MSLNCATFQRTKVTLRILARMFLQGNFLQVLLTFFEVFSKLGSLTNQYDL